LIRRRVEQPDLVEPGVAVTQTFITIGSFDAEAEARACLKYLKSKFARTMLGVLKITQGGSGTATGVGIQVVDNQGVPVKFGEDTLVGPSKNGDYVLPYTARYYQTGNKVTPGRADGTATFTLDYK